MIKTIFVIAPVGLSRTDSVGSDARLRSWFKRESITTGSVLFVYLFIFCPGELSKWRQGLQPMSRTGTRC